MDPPFLPSAGLAIDFAAAGRGAWSSSGCERKAAWGSRRLEMEVLLVMSQAVALQGIDVGTNEQNEAAPTVWPPVQRKQSQTRLSTLGQ